MSMIIFIFMNLIIGVCAYLAVSRIFKITGLVDSAIALFVLACSQIVITELILGVAGELYLKELILFNILILMILLIFSRPVSGFCRNNLKDEVLKLFDNKAIMLGIVIILTFASVKIFINLVNPPFGWDSLNYHFTFPVEWLKQANLATPITIADDPGPTYYPINGSLFYLWFIFPLKNVFLADLGQLPFFLLAGISVFGISRKLGLDKEYSCLAVILFMLIPNFFKQLQIAYVDVMVAALFLSSVNCLFLLGRKFSLANTIIYSASTGLLLGIKAIALPYCVLLFIPFIYLLIKNKNRFYFLLISLGLIIILGGFSYIRNFIETGNPLYPLNFKLFGRAIFHGPIEQSTYRLRFQAGDYSFTKLLFHEGLGAQTILFVFPALFLSVPLVLYKKKAVSFIQIYFLILPLSVYLVYKYIIPYANTRYLYCLLGMGTVIALYVVQILNPPRKVISILAALCILISMGELAKRQELYVSLALTVLLLLMSFYLIKFIRRNNFILLKKPYIYLTIIIFAVISLIALQKFYVNNEYRRYGIMTKYSGFWPDAALAWDWLNRNTSGNNIAYTGRPAPFPLYGENFKNNVYYVSINTTEPAKLHFFPLSHYSWGRDFETMHTNMEEKANYRGQAEYSVWLKNLNNRSIDYLFVYSLHQTKGIIFPLEDNWAKDNPDKFTPVFSNQTIHIYRIIR